MRTTRGAANRQLRRARLLAARTRRMGTINRRGIVCGDWDRGAVVRAWMNDNSTATPLTIRKLNNERLQLSQSR